jgi:hypothetical protein
MTLLETIIVVVCVIAAAVVAVAVGDVPPVLAGLLGAALGYVGKGVGGQIAERPINRGEPIPFKGAPDA